MARRRSRNRLLVPEAREGLEHLKAEVIRREGYAFDPSHPESAKYAVAQKLGVPLGQGKNEQLTTRSVGQVGGAIGGKMVREMVRLAQEQLVRQSRS
jgi:small acid-soluble spore protein D (minor alpha/beta-type SASP)